MVGRIQYSCIYQQHWLVALPRIWICTKDCLNPYTKHASLDTSSSSSSKEEKINVTTIRTLMFIACRLSAMIRLGSTISTAVKSCFSLICKMERKISCSEMKTTPNESDSFTTKHNSTKIIFSWWKWKQNSARKKKKKDLFILKIRIIFFLAAGIFFYFSFEILCILAKMIAIFLWYYKSWCDWKKTTKRRIVKYYFMAIYWMYGENRDICFIRKSKTLYLFIYFLNVWMWKLFIC